MADTNFKPMSEVIAQEIANENGQGMLTVNTDTIAFGQTVRIERSWGKLTFFTYGTHQVAIRVKDWTKVTYRQTDPGLYQFEINQ